MQRHKATYPLAPGKADELKHRMLRWANRFSILCFLDSNNYPSPYAGYECLLAAGEVDAPNEINTLSKLQLSHDEHKDWHFGHICYDHKNCIEPKLVSAHPVKNGFPNVVFFIPRTVCHINREQTTVTVESFDDPNLVYQAINETDLAQRVNDIPELNFTKVIDREDYLSIISKLRTHIADGDCYEINFCNEGFCENVDIAPLDVFNALMALSPAPFAAYYRLRDKYMMCASPERYLRKTGRHLLCQPIKGTARRDKDPVKDKQISEALRNDIKERAENVMITDLMRNDLARVCETGTVNVDELFGVYTFPQVHQLISTVSGTMRPGVNFTDAIRHSFPMGSMTGAPKYKVMELIETYERSRRELFSGTVGYITPGGDFDLNVIIRSLFYNATDRYLSYQTGGAITYDSNAELEWEEMRLKAWALERIFAE